MRARLCHIHTEKYDRKARCGGTRSELGGCRKGQVRWHMLLRTGGGGESCRKTGRAELFWAKTEILSGNAEISFSLINTEGQGLADLSTELKAWSTLSSRPDWAI